MIKISNVSFSYNKNKEVLHDVSFEVNKGECVVLLGPNGVGKSTLLTLILGTNKVQKGEIVFDDKNINNLKHKERAKYLAYVPQLIGGNDLTVRETILLGKLPHYQIYPNKKDYEEVDKYLAEFHLEELRDKPTNQISGGERQKVSIARGLIQNSEVVLFDEPTSNLDIRAQIDILSIIKSERDKKEKSFIISMHDINQAIAIGDKFIFLKEGRVEKICKKDEIDESIIEKIYSVKAKIHKENGGTFITYED